MDVKKSNMPPRPDAFTIKARRFKPEKAAPPAPRFQPAKKAQAPSQPARAWLVVLLLCGLFLLLPNLSFALLHLVAVPALVAVLEPLVSGLVRRDVPRVLAVSFVLALAGAFVTTVLTLLWPYLLKEIATLSAALQASEPEKVANKLGVLLLKALPWLRTKSILQQLQSELTPHVTRFVQAALSFETALLSNFIGYGLVAFAAFYLLNRPEQTRRTILRAVPNPRLETAALFYEKVLPRLGGYLRMQALLFAVSCPILAAAFHLMHLPGIVGMSVYGALALATPYWGALLGAIPLAVAAMNSTNSVNIVFGIVITMALMQLFNNLLLLSRDRRKRVRLNPVEGLLALLLGASFGGVWGILLGGPVMILCKIVAAEWYAARNNSRRDFSVASAPTERSFPSLGDRTVV